jgi:hypothetical protein
LAARCRLIDSALTDSQTDPQSVSFSGVDWPTVELTDSLPFNLACQGAKIGEVEDIGNLSWLNLTFGHPSPNLAFSPSPNLAPSPSPSLAFSPNNKLGEGEDIGNLSWLNLTFGHPSPNLAFPPHLT